MDHNTPRIKAKDRRDTDHSRWTCSDQGKVNIVLVIRERGSSPVQILTIRLAISGHLEEVTITGVSGRVNKDTTDLTRR
ncbi:hypothetical protein RRG08_005947 [Elysia crispata]|uniref:Uncharacterized protein n=1 Tax=Elysia crispata TaxID=231223 RepID=A0AAE0ZJY5_9GAST|nr:hypothetical protein RRG08_005947 [Elysia crispata]